MNREEGKTASCLTFAEFRELVGGEQGGRLPADRQRHLSQCSECSRLLRMFECFRNVQRDELGLAASWEQHRHMDVWEFLRRYLEGDLAPVSACVFLSHLKSCEHCYHELQGSLAEAFSEPEVSASSAPIAVAHRLDWLRQRLASLGKVTPLTEPRPPQEVDDRPRRLRSLLARWQHQPILARAVYVAAFVLLVIVVVQSRNLYVEQKAERFADSALADLRAAHRITGDWPWRPSGGFRPSVFSEVRGPNISTDSLFNSAAQKLLQARRGAARKATVLHDLGLFYLVRGERDSADFYFQKAYEQSPASPDLLNDLGLARLSQGDTTSALRAWRKSIALDPNAREALFNLALLYQRLGDTTAAASAWRRYLKRGAKSDSLAGQTLWPEFARWQLEHFGGSSSF